MILSLLCSIAAVSAENSDMADDSCDIHVIDSDTQSSVFIGDNNQLSMNDSSSGDGDGSSGGADYSSGDGNDSSSGNDGSNAEGNDSSSSEPTNNSVSSNNSSSAVSGNSKLSSKKVPRVWINRMVIKSKVTIIKLKSDKRGIIYYTTDGKNPTIKSRKFRNNITLPSNRVLKYFVRANDGTKSKIFSYKRILGKTSKGYVEKLYYGNLSSNQTIVLIVGVHVQESGMHKAIQNSLKRKNSKLNRRFVLYFIHVTKDQRS